MGDWRDDVQARQPYTQPNMLFYFSLYLSTVEIRFVRRFLQLRAIMFTNDLLVPLSTDGKTFVESIVTERYTILSLAVFSHLEEIR